MLLIFNDSWGIAVPQIGQRLRMHKGQFVLRRGILAEVGSAATVVPPTFDLVNVVNAVTDFRVLTLDISAVAGAGTAILVHVSKSDETGPPFSVRVPNVTGEVDIDLPGARFVLGDLLTAHVTTIDGAGEKSKPSVGYIQAYYTLPLISNGSNEDTTFLEASDIFAVSAIYASGNTDTSTYLWEFWTNSGATALSTSDTGISTTVPNEAFAQWVTLTETAYRDDGVLLGVLRSDIYAIDALIAFPAVIEPADFIAASVTDPTEAASIEGRRKATVDFTDFSIPAGVELRVSLGSTSGVPFSGTMDAITEAAPSYTTPDGLVPGVTIYPYLFWHIPSNGTSLLACTGTPFVLAPLDEPPDVQLYPSFVRMSSGITTTPSVAWSAGEVVIAESFDGASAGTALVAPDARFTPLAAVLQGSSGSSRLYVCQTDPNSFTWMKNTKFYVFKDVDPIDPIGALATPTVDASTSDTDYQAITVTGAYSTVVDISHSRGAGSILHGARPGLTPFIAGSHIQGGVGVSPAVNLTANLNVANTSGTTGGTHHWTLELNGSGPIDPTPPFPPDFVAADWSAFCVTNAADAGGVTGKRTVSIVAGVSWDESLYRLFSYLNTAANPTPAITMAELTEVSRTFTTSGGLALGSVVQPKLYWYKISDGSFQLCGTRPSFTITAIDTPTGTTVSAAGLQAALLAATGGETFLVQPGTVSSINITGKVFTSTVTVQPTDRNNPPRYNSFNASQCRRLKIDGITFGPGVTVRTGTCINLTSAQDIEVVDCLTLGGRTGITISKASRITLHYNTLEGQGVEGIVGFYSINDIVIRHNRHWKTNIDLNNTDGGDHPDMVQFNCNPNDVRSVNMLYEGNYLRSEQIGSSNHGMLTGKAALWQTGRPLVGTGTAVLGGFDNPALPMSQRPCGAVNWTIRGNYVMANHRDGVLLEGMVSSLVEGNVYRVITQALASNPGPTISRREEDAPMINAKSFRNNAFAGPGVPYQIHKDLTIRDNVVTAASSGSLDTDPWGRTSAWGTVTVTGHVRSDTALPAYWGSMTEAEMFALTGQYAPRP